MIKFEDIDVLKFKIPINDCDKCHMLQFIWLHEEYKEPKEPEVDWSKVEVDTPIYVKAYDTDAWRRRYFSKYENGKIYTWANGATSWSSENEEVGWHYGKAIMEN